MSKNFVLMTVLVLMFSATFGAHFTTPVRAEETTTFTDLEGQYAYTQGISQNHHVTVQEEPSTLYISSDYTFTGDIYETIVVAADNIVIDGNGYTLEGPGDGCGFYLNGRSNVTIKNVTIKKWVNGVWLYRSSNNVISGNNIVNNWEGVWLWASSDYNTISENNITNNKRGVWLHHSSNNIISRNNITANNWDGIWLYYSSHNVISGNNITNNEYGIWLHCYSDYNSISGNNIAKNLDGVYLHRSSSNIIYHNNFIDNINKQAYDDTNPAKNNWHHPDLLEGNYWSDYTGIDDGSGTGKHAIAGDGIGDTDIPWSGLDYDYYPFVHEIRRIDATPPVTTISLSGTLGLDGWYVADVTLTLSATDELSGVTETAYSFDGATWIAYTEAFCITTEGIITVYYNSTDNAGNEETPKSAGFKIDKTSPEVSAGFIPIEVEEDEGLFEIGYSANDLCDPDPEIIAVILTPTTLADPELELKVDDEIEIEFGLEDNQLVIKEIKGPEPQALWQDIRELGGIRVELGQRVFIEIDGETEFKTNEGILKIEGLLPTLKVTATDASGNTGEATSKPIFVEEIEKE